MTHPLLPSSPRPQGFLTKDRFMRVLSTLKMMPDTPKLVEVLLKRFETPHGYDYKTFLDILHLT